MMKRLALSLIFAALTIKAALAQGSINYNIRVPGLLVAHVYGPETGVNPSASGNTASDIPSGNAVYTGVLLAGTGYSAQLFAANGSGQSPNALTAVPGSLVSFRTGSGAGTIVPSVLSIPQVPVGGTGTFQLRAWDNVGGTILSWDESVFHANNTPHGVSAPFDIAELTDGTNPPNMMGFRSFGLKIIPEPTTYALLGLGVLSLLFFKRKK